MQTHGDSFAFQYLFWFFSHPTLYVVSLSIGNAHFGGLIVSSGTVVDGQNKHHAGLFPNVANNSVIANAITPQPAKFMTQGLPEAAGVFVGCNAGVHVVKNFPLHGAVNRLQVFLNPRVVFNRPDQGFRATDWK